MNKTQELGLPGGPVVKIHLHVQGHCSDSLIQEDPNTAWSNYVEPETA